MQKGLDIKAIVDRFLRAAQGRELTRCEPWNYGWSQASYRRSATAAMMHGEGQSVKLQPSAVAFFEEASSALLQLEKVRRRYEVNEFWSLTASLVGTLPLNSTPDELATAIEQWIKNVLEPPDSLVVFAVANIARLENVLDIGPLLLGHFDETFAEQLRKKVGRTVLASARGEPWGCRPTT